MSLPAGARLAVDVGTVRIGVAVAATGTTVAVPVGTVAAGPDAVADVTRIVREQAAEVVYVGDPIRLNGEVGPAARAAREFAARLNRNVSQSDSSVTVWIRMVDERFTTAQSSRQMRAAGRSTRHAREVLDQAAAVAILHNALERERATGRLAGMSVEQD